MCRFLQIIHWYNTNFPFRLLFRYVFSRKSDLIWLRVVAQKNYCYILIFCGIILEFLDFNWWTSSLVYRSVGVVPLVVDLILDVKVNERVANGVVLRTRLLIVVALFIVVLPITVIVAMVPSAACWVFPLAPSVLPHTIRLRLSLVQRNVVVEHTKPGLIRLCHVEDIDIWLCNTINPVHHDPRIFS